MIKSAAILLKSVRSFIQSPQEIALQNRYKSLLLNSVLCWLLCYAAVAASQTTSAVETPLPGDQSAELGAAQPNPQQALSELFPADEVVWLPADGERVLALYLEEQSGSARGGVIILTDYYHQPTERYWINNLRHTLPAKQWHSLVLAMPTQEVSLTVSTTPPDATAVETEQNPVAPATTETEPEPENKATDDSTPAASLDSKAEQAVQKTNNQRRALAAIDAAINYFNTQQIVNIAIVSEGGSAVYALQYLSSIVDSEQSKKILGLALIDARNHFNDTSLIDLLAEQTLPMLDIYLGLDFRDQREAQQREIASRQLPTGQYLQIAMPRIATRWDNHEDRLSKRVRGWLDRSASAEEVSQ